MTLHIVDQSKKRGIDTFLDNKRLRKGRNFQEEFVTSLINTLVVVPIVSRNALERLSKSKFDPNVEDNMLIEWIISLECLNSAHTSIRSPTLATRILVRSLKIIPLVKGV